MNNGTVTGSVYGGCNTSGTIGGTATVTVIGGTVGTADANRLIPLMNPSVDRLFGAPRPDVIVFSKPDIYDFSGSLRRFLDENGFRKAAVFSVFSVFSSDAALLPEAVPDGKLDFSESI